MADHSNTSPSGDVFSKIPEYDAFISYKHGTIDSAAARALQKNLEHFRAPILSGIRLPGTPFSGKEGKPKKTGRIRRVFLDDGELSACAAFGSHIREALKKSRWLIIICSPETKKSPWVNLEVETFLEYHDRNHILAVMTGGEPADIFPEAFAGSGSLPDEMLAADARGETVREVLKKLRGDALLRVAAPILGLTYDDLKQRSKIYRLQRLAAAAVACLAAVTCFSMYAVSKNRQLERSNTDLWLRQAEITSREAQDLLDQGDNLQAVHNLLSLLPDGSEEAAGRRPDGLLLPSTQYLLTRALNLYKPALIPNYGEDRLAASAVINTDDYMDEDLLSSPDGAYLLASFVISGNNVMVWDTETCRQVCKIQLPERFRITNWSGEAVLDKSRIFLCGGHIAACFDYTTGEQLWKTTVLNEVCTTASPAGSSAAVNSPAAAPVPGPDRLFILTSAGISVLDAKDGSLLSECKYNLIARDTLSEAETDSDSDREPSVGSPDKAVFSPDGRFIVFSSKSEQDHRRYLFACDPGTGETMQIDPEGFHDIEDIETEARADGKGISIYYAGRHSESGSESMYVLKSATLFSSVRCKEEWRKEYLYSTVTYKRTVSGSLVVRILPSFKQEGAPTALVFCCHAHIFMLDPLNGRTLSDQELPSNMTALLSGKDMCFPFTSQGEIYSFDGKSLLPLSDVFPAGSRDIVRAAGNNIFFCLTDKRKIVKYSPMVTDNRYTSLSMNTDDDSNSENASDDVSSAVPLFHNPDWLVSANHKRIFWIGNNETIIHSLSRDQIVKKARSETASSASSGEADLFSDSLLSDNPKPLYLEGNILHFIDFARRDLSDSEKDYVCFEYNLNLSDSSLTAKALFVSRERFPDTGNLHIDEDRHILYYLQPHEDYTMLWSCTLNTGDISGSVLPQGNIDYSSLSPDGRKLLLLSLNDLKLYIMDISSKKTGATISLSDYTHDSIETLYSSIKPPGLCWNKNTIVLNDYLKIHIYDKAGTEIRTIPCGESVLDPSRYEYPLLSLSPDGKYLYYYVSGRLFQYDISQGRKINEIRLSESGYTPSQWLCQFGGEEQMKSDRSASSDTVHILTDRVLYTIQCNTDSFGLISRVDNVFNYNRQTGKIYVYMYNSGKKIYEFLYYPEYSLEEIIRTARERYGIDEQESTGPAR